MPEDPKPEETPPERPEAGDHREEEEASDFITRQVLEKDSVFFEG